MSRFYQNVLTGEKVEVKTLDEDDFYIENKANWSRIPAPPVDEAEASRAGAVLAHHKAEEATASEAGRELEAHQKQTKPAPKRKG